MIARLEEDERRRQAEAAATRWIEKYDPEDIPRLAMAIVGKAGKKLQKDLSPGIRKSKVFRKLRPQVYAERDGQIAKHMKEVIFPRKRSALLRLCCCRSVIPLPNHVHGHGMQKP